MIVAIVGRPNVGKSTLFNRIINKRLAITLKEPGTTRDRISAQAHWQGVKFTLIDTGGYQISNEDFAKEITNQVNQAIELANIIIFMVDGSMPPAPTDFAIAEQLRKSRKSYIVAVNKTDTKISQEYLYEFYQLGGEELIPISAEHGKGVDELLDAIITKIKKQQLSIDQTIKKPDLRLLILGRPNVGKSMLFNQILKEQRVIVSEIPGTTRDAIEEEFEFDGRKFKIIDTAGLRKKAKIKKSIEYYSVQRAISQISNADVVLLLLDAQSQRPLTSQDKNIIQLVLRRGKGMVIAINKIDLVPKNEQNNLLNRTKINLQQFNFIPVMTMSALYNQGIINVIKKVQDVFEQGQKKLDDELLNQTIVSRIKANPPSSNLKYVFLRQVGVLPPHFALITNVAKEIKLSYQRFIIKEIRNYFGFAGNPIRLTIKTKH